jgi:D-alanyl-D-alanine carboxypeptidase
MVSPLVGSSDDIRPTPVRTLRVRATTIKATSIGSEVESAHAVVPVTPTQAAPQPETDAVTPTPPPVEAQPAPTPPTPHVVTTPVAAPVVATVTAPPPTPVIQETREAKPIKAAATIAPAPAPVAAPAVAAPSPAPAIQEARETKPIMAAAAVTSAARPAPIKPAVVADAAEPKQDTSAEAAAAPAREAMTRDGWVIQVGALESVSAAKERLGSAQSSAAKILKQADPFTEKVVKGDKTLYRARFAGLDKGQAEAACRALKRSDIPCMLIAAANKN